MKDWKVGVNGHSYEVEAGSKSVAIKKGVQKYIEGAGKHRETYDISIIEKGDRL